MRYWIFCHFEHNLRYTYSVSSTAFDIEVLCNKNNRDNPLAQAFSSSLGKSPNAYPPMFIRRFEQVVDGRDIGEESICRENLKGMAIVKFQIASQIISKIKKTKRVSFSDQLSNIGKYFQKNIYCQHLLLPKCSMPKYRCVYKNRTT